MFRDLDQMKLLRQSSFINLFTAASLVCGYSVAAAAVNDPVAELDALLSGPDLQLPVWDDPSNLNETHEPKGEFEDW
jgi:hypothetical protein